jgi:tryptophan-rich sensory protein
MKKESWVKLVIAILVCQLAGIAGAIYTSGSLTTWYVTLAKPLFNPPNWIFAPVWISLFLLMGISLWLVWQKEKKKNINTAFVFFSIQLVLNAMWSAFFFGMQNPLYALIDIALLWLAIVATILSFWKISKPAAYLLVPYILWVTFAAVLNFYIWRLN